MGLSLQSRGNSEMEYLCLVWDPLKSWSKSKSGHSTWEWWVVLFALFSILPFVAFSRENVQIYIWESDLTFVLGSVPWALFELSSLLPLWLKTFRIQELFCILESEHLFWPLGRSLFPAWLCPSWHNLILRFLTVYLQYFLSKTDFQQLGSFY